VLDVTAPRLSVSVTGAGARTAEQVADDIVASMPGFDLKRSAVKIAGQDAVMLDNVVDMRGVGAQRGVLRGDRLGRTHQAGVGVERLAPAGKGAFSTAR
jgi:hypothetical protein